MINPRAWIAELIATFSFVFLGTVSVTIAVPILGGGYLTTAGLLIIALAHGLGIALMICAVGRISGGHINPAVTISMLVARKIGSRDALGYIIFQLIGAIIASALHRFILESGSVVQWGLHQPNPAINGNQGLALLVEIILTFFLIFTIFGVAVAPKSSPSWAGFAIGGMVVLLSLVGVSLTGASMNPARSFGPAIITWNFTHNWIYWLGPIFGGIIAAVSYKYVLLIHDE